MDHSDPKNIEEIKKEIRRIRRSGNSTQLLGWFSLFLAAGVIWLIQVKLYIFIAFASLIVFGLFFIYSGKYVKVGKGRKTKLLLLINGLLSLPYCVLILPLYVCVQSFNNRSRFKDLPENIQALYIKPKKLHIAWWEILLLILVLAGCGASLFFKLNELNKPVVSSTTQPQAEEINTISKSHFTIGFPTAYGATDLTKQVSGHPVNYTVYTTSGDSTAKIYYVYAYSYPSSMHYDTMTAANLSKVIHGTVVSTVNDLHGKLISTNPTTFANYASEEGQFTSQTMSGTLTGYIRVFFVGNYQYVITSVGASSMDFSAFANSFNYR